MRGLSTEAGSPGALGQSSLGQNESIQSMASNAVAVSSEAGSVYTNSPAPVDTLTADIYNIQNNQGTAAIPHGQEPVSNTFVQASYWAT